MIAVVKFYSRWDRWIVVFPLQRFVLLFALTLLSIAPACKQQQTQKMIVDPVPIVTELDPNMFPESWLVPSIKAWAKPVHEKEKERAISQVRTAMSKYPTQFLQENLDKVYVVGELGFSGITAAGTNSTDRVYLAAKSIANGYSNRFIRGAFHHEFSSILLRNHGTIEMEQAWAAANPDGFVYSGDGTQAVADDEDSEDYNATLAVDGFYSQYAKASYEEDFNTIATVLFHGDKDLWDASQQFPPIKTKLDLMIKFFEELDPKFNRRFFESLR